MFNQLKNIFTPKEAIPQQNKAYRDIKTAEKRMLAPIHGITPEINTMSINLWEDGYWEMWVANEFVDKDKIIATQDGFALVAKGDDKNGWKFKHASSFCKKIIN